MTEVVSTVCSSTITFGNGAEEFSIPDALEIQPAHILDETNSVYRLSIGRVYSGDDEDAPYKRLFEAIDARSPFIENMHVTCGNRQLTLKLAYVMKTRKSYGIFYDIEATGKEFAFIERKPSEQT